MASTLPLTARRIKYTIAWRRQTLAALPPPIGWIFLFGALTSPSEAATCKECDLRMLYHTEGIIGTPEVFM